MENWELTKRERKALRKLEHKAEQAAQTKAKSSKNILGILGLIAGGLIIGWTLIPTLQTANPQPPLLSKTALLEIAKDDYLSGQPNAKVVLMEYLDFECEACRAYYPLVKELQDEFKDDLAVVTRYFPLPGHKNGLPAALAVEAAARQGKFIEMHNILFENQEKWGEKRQSDSNIFLPYAEQIGLNIEQFKRDLSEKSVMERVKRDQQSGVELGVQSTPSFFLNGVKIQNTRSYEDFKTLIQAELIKSPANQKIGEKVHEHSDLKVYLNDTLLNLSQDKYQSTKEKPLNEDTHLHDGNGNNVHKHRTKITMGDFFKSLGIGFTKDCFILDTGENFCSEGDKTLKFFVNGKENQEFGQYEFTDLDRLLITYGSPSPEVLQKQLNSVTDQACLYSEKCPERGTPPTENCAVGLGGDC